MTSKAVASARHDMLSDSSLVIWRKSSWSTYNNGCVGVGALRSGVVGVRDTKGPDDGPVLPFDEATWSGFLTRVKNGELNLNP